MNLQQDQRKLVVGPGPTKSITGEAVGTGDTVLTTFDRTLVGLPIQPGSLVVTVASGGAFATDNGAGGFTGAGIAAGSTINYETGALHMVYSAAPAAVAITAAYRQFTPYAAKSVVIGVGNDVLVNFKSTLAALPIRPKSVSIVADAVTATDNGKGVLSGSGVAAGSTIDYRTGKVNITFSVAPAGAVNVTCAYESVQVLTNQIPPKEMDVQGRALDSIRVSVPADAPAAAKVTVVVESSDTPAEENFIEDGRFVSIPVGGDAIKKITPVGRYVRFTGYSYGSPKPFPVDVTLNFRN